MRSYSEMAALPTFADRFRYLKLGGLIGQETFGIHRFVNQRFYQSRDWKSVRSEVIIRDNGCDLAIPDRQIGHRIFIHHINPLTLEDFENESPLLYDLDNLVCVSYDTHLAIHYGNENMLPPVVLERCPGDTTLW